MFKKLATLRAARPRDGAALTSAHSSIPRPDRPVALAPRRARRYVLVCRWFSVPATGRLECRWQLEPIGETAAEAPGPTWRKGYVHRHLPAPLRGKRAAGASTAHKPRRQK